MKITYKPENTEEVLKLLYDCLTTGLTYFPAYGFSLEVKPSDYKAAKKVLLDGRPEEDELCIEDIQTQVLRMGRDLTFINHEEDDEKTRFNLDLALKNWDKIAEHCPSAMQNYVDENWDANDADVIWQALMFGEIVYG